MSLSNNMKQIQHTNVEVRGVNLHVAEVGKGEEAVLFLHGFPGTCYSLRHQMIGLAKAGYRAIAVDFRGHGLSDPSPEPEETSFSGLANDVIDLLDCSAIKKASLVGKGFGAIVANMVAVSHPERVASLITLGIPFMVPGLSVLQTIDNLPKGIYIKRWQEPGRAEADFGRFDEKTVIRKIYTHLSGSEVQVAADDMETLDLVDSSTPLPPWFTEEDLAVYASLYKKSGFRTALQVPYRSFGEKSVITDPKINCPSLLIMGEKDHVFKFPGIDYYARYEQVKHFMGGLETMFVPDGNHFIQEQLPDKVNELIITFLREHSI